MKTIDENRPQDNVEVVKKCSKCGGEYAMNFTPRTAEDWRVIYENIEADGLCQKCAYYRGDCAECGKPVNHVYPWYTGNPEKLEFNPKPLHEECVGKFRTQEDR